MVLGKHNDEVRHTIQSERRPSVTTNSTVSPRKMMVVTVDVLAGSEVKENFDCFRNNRFAAQYPDFYHWNFPYTYS